MSSEKQRANGSAAMAALECAVEKGRATQKPAPVSRPKDKRGWQRRSAFFAERMERRKTPGYCCRCGKPSGSKYPHGHCEQCKAWTRAWKRGLQPKIVFDERLFREYQKQVALSVERSLAGVRRQIALLSIKVETLRLIARRSYARGYYAGAIRERHLYQEARAEWDDANAQRAHLVGARLGVEEAKQFSHVWDNPN